MMLGRRPPSIDLYLDALSRTSLLFSAFGMFPLDRSPRIGVLTHISGPRWSYIAAERRCPTSSKLSPSKPAETDSHNISRPSVDSLHMDGEDAEPSTVPNGGNTCALLYQTLARTTRPSPSFLKSPPSPNRYHNSNHLVLPLCRTDLTLPQTEASDITLL